MNAARRLETAQCVLDMLVAQDGLTALEASEKLEELNVKRRGIQNAIFEEACVQAEKLADDRTNDQSSRQKRKPSRPLYQLPHMCP